MKIDWDIFLYAKAKIEKGITPANNNYKYASDAFNDMEKIFRIMNSNNKILSAWLRLKEKKFKNNIYVIDGDTTFCLYLSI